MTPPERAAPGDRLADEGGLRDALKSESPMTQTQSVEVLASEVGAAAEAAIISEWALGALEKDARETLDAHDEWLNDNDEQPDPGPDEIGVHPSTLLKLTGIARAKQGLAFAELATLSAKLVESEAREKTTGDLLNLALAALGELHEWTKLDLKRRGCSVAKNGRGRQLYDTIETLVTEHRAALTLKGRGA